MASATRADARSTTRTTARGSSRGTSRTRRGEDRTIFGVPERFMRPRLIFIAVTAILVGFGLVMVYSSSSVTALLADGDAASYVKKQLLMAVVGTAFAIAIARADYHFWCSRRVLPIIWVVTVVLLVLVFTPFAGVDALGASRWITVGGFQVQPSEFAKLSIVLVAASLAERYFDEGTLSQKEFLKLIVVGVVVPTGLIILQPDKGTTLVLGVTLIVMLRLAGASRKVIAGLFILGLAGFLFISFRDDYSRQRFVTMFDPWSDPYDSGYQLIQGFYAFASGGIKGVGIGFSRQKYSYLPYAYNDFIYAVIGEECGLVGTVGLLVGFGVFLWAGFKIAQHAPDLTGRLIAFGCTLLIVVQMLLNVAGVVGIFPLTGKPIPFISYGGTSMLASLLIAGMIVSVSVHSHLPETPHDSARRSWQLEGRGEGEPERLAGGGLSFVGEPVPRSTRRSGGDAGPGRGSGRGTGRGSSRGESPSGRGLTVMDGGARDDAARSRGRSDRGTRGAGRSGSGRSSRGGASMRGDRSTPRGRSTRDVNGRTRIDLGPTAAERLRGDDRSER